ncbi:MAG: MBL fold metallo-hydrolase [Eubacteriales bacterium]|nr:MBL fold metallo-hydrolase [Eubacteriales bacterium]
MNDFAIRVLTAPVGKTALFSTGQAGYIIKSKSGQLLGMDMYLTDCVERIEGHVGYHRLLPKLLTPGELEFDVVVATHPHKDHFDDDAIPVLMDNEHTRLIASVDCEKDIQRLSMSMQRVTIVKPGDHVHIGDFDIDLVNCDHGAGAPDAVGVVVTVDGKKVFMAGDTCLRLDRTGEYQAKGPFDVMIAPINGAYGNMNEEECVTLAATLKPKLTIPCHYGMFAPHGGNPGKFYDLMRTMHPELGFKLMQQGERIIL